jgi:MFS family permease
MSVAPVGSKPPFTAVKWLICIITSIGFAFDIFALLMAQYVVPPALKELGGLQPNTSQHALWAGMMFWVPAIAGGIFGLLGGYLTDIFGRRRILTWSILLYAFSAFASGYSTSLTMLLILRSTTFIGVCVEFVAAVAWLAELFEDHAQRERALGYTQAFSSFGGLLVAAVYGYCNAHAKTLPAIQLPGFLSSLGAIADAHASWRYTLISGLIPAIPLILIRPFLPESPVWAAKKSAGTLRRPSLAEIFAPQFRRTTLVTTIMFACSYGAAFGAIQQMPQIVARFSEVKAKTKDKPKPEAAQIQRAAAAEYGKVQEIGGLVGRFLLAILAVRILSRRALLRVFQIPGLILMPLIFWGFATQENARLFQIGSWELTWMQLGIFICGLCTVAQFSFWGNYLPYVYPVHLRGTGESFAANIGGRLLGTSFYAVTSFAALAPGVPGDSPYGKTAFAAAAVALLVYLIGSIACFWLPQPKTTDLMSE